MDNTKKLMDEQGYEKKEVDEAVDIADDKQKELLARTIARWQNVKTDDDEKHGEWLKGTCFDRWR